MTNTKEFGRILLFGASSGVGLEVSRHLAERCTDMITVSRRKPEMGRWIKTDVSSPESIHQLSKALGEDPIDGLLYLGGTWEKHAFTPDYSFETCSDDDLENVLNVNLLAPIRLIQQLLANLRKSPNAKIIIVGAAVGGLNLNASWEVSNTSSKFGLRGLIFSLRQLLRKDRIGITLINLGNIATPEVLGDLQTSGLDETHAIPLADLFSLIDYLLKLSNRTNINEIDMPSMA